MYSVDLDHFRAYLANTQQKPCSLAASSKLVGGNWHFRPASHLHIQAVVTKNDITCSIGNYK